MKYRLRQPVGNGRGNRRPLDVTKYIMQGKCTRETIHKHSIGLMLETTNILTDYSIAPCITMEQALQKRSHHQYEIACSYGLFGSARPFSPERCVKWSRSALPCRSSWLAVLECVPAVQGFKRPMAMEWLWTFHHITPKNGDQSKGVYSSSDQ